MSCLLDIPVEFIDVILIKPHIAQQRDGYGQLVLKARARRVVKLIEIDVSGVVEDLHHLYRRIFAQRKDLLAAALHDECKHDPGPDALSARQVRDDLIAALGDKVFDAMIPYLTEASNAPRERRSCVSKPGSEIGRAYMAVAKEVLVR